MTCQQCGRELPPGTHPRTQFCRSCIRERHIAGVRKRALQASIYKTCLRCGRDLEPGELHIKALLREVLRRDGGRAESAARAGEGREGCDGCSACPGCAGSRILPSLRLQRHERVQREPVRLSA